MIHFELYIGINHQVVLSIILFNSDINFYFSLKHFELYSVRNEKFKKFFSPEEMKVLKQTQFLWKFKDGLSRIKQFS